MKSLQIGSIQNTSINFKAIFNIEGIYLFKNHLLSKQYQVDVQNHNWAKANMEMIVEREQLLVNAVWANYPEFAPKGIFASRVSLHEFPTGFDMSVDGIPLCSPINDATGYTSHIQQIGVLAYLNMMSTHGVDAFMENYKEAYRKYSKKLEVKLINEIEELSSQQILDDLQKNKLNNLQINLNRLLSILFLVDVHLCIGIENERYVNAYQELEKMLMIA